MITRKSTLGRCPRCTEVTWHAHCERCSRGGTVRVCAPGLMSDDEIERMAALKDRLTKHLEE
jgi:hypothetical protein